jgi:hypothetical protein
VPRGVIPRQKWIFLASVGRCTSVVRVRFRLSRRIELLRNSLNPIDSASEKTRDAGMSRMIAYPVEVAYAGDTARAD